MSSPKPGLPVVIAEFDKNSRERVRVTLDNYRGVDTLDMRITAPLSETAGVHAPTKKGLTIRVALLPDLLEALHAAEGKARALGLLPPEGA